MTDSTRREAVDGWWPTRRRLREAYLTAALPVIACLVGLCGLTAWAGSGAAGAPPRIAVDDGRVFLPYAGKENTAAFFRVSNLGGADDQLVSVTSPDVEQAMLSRHQSAGTGADSMNMTGPLDIPAGDTLAMSPFGADVMVKVKERWQAGQVVRFVLHFRHSKPVETIAIVVRPGS
ncbi:copper chaperone PCu(A)C [Streptomyces sp. APSN-46.1]|uniref:copper chaperone PCu(A)C n=1 Tax=Streptomyces sp. APSN-46.1 TaxID=2929049 RepID=UPI001FB36B5D|nr:copper chaperone PCu(A)C [Streptomyces sp. APSN-46.1]MCJ1676231.1 copper chaperone PCu(A)C [Streptomyces sp. APSN-46.1]